MLWITVADMMKEFPLDLFDLLLSPFAYEFMVRGLIISVMVGILCSVIGAYVVLRSMAFLGDAMAHAILPGVALSYIWKGNLTLGALAASLVVAFSISGLSKKGVVKEDTAIGILFSASLALGIAMISSIKTYAVDLSHILFGNLLGISNDDLILTGTIGLLVLVTIWIAWKPFLVMSFDPTHARMIGLPVNFLRHLLFVLLALSIVVSLQSVGVGLVSALLVTPAATAYLVTRRLSRMMLFSALIGGFSGLVGLYISYYMNIASGSAIVLVATIIFVLVYLFAPQKGQLSQLWKRFRPQEPK